MIRLLGFLLRFKVSFQIGLCAFGNRFQVYPGPVFPLFVSSILLCVQIRWCGGTHLLLFLYVSAF